MRAAWILGALAAIFAGAALADRARKGGNPRRRRAWWIVAGAFGAVAIYLELFSG